MSLASEYQRQLAWRDWAKVLDALPLEPGQLVLDLGCGPGDLAAALVVRGTRVIGFDLNEELLAVARARRLPNAEFRSADLRSLPELDLAADGLWSSFAAAYVLDLPSVLASWTPNLKPGGWIALTEIDDFFAHEPLAGQTKALLAGYVEDALAAGRYDFRMGRKHRSALELAGFTVERELARVCCCLARLPAIASSLQACPDGEPRPQRSVASAARSLSFKR